MDVCKWKRQLQKAIRNFIPLNTDIAVTGKRGKEDEQIPSRLLAHNQDPHVPLIWVPSGITVRPRHHTSTSHPERSSHGRGERAASTMGQHHSPEWHLHIHFSSLLEVPATRVIQLFICFIANKAVAKIKPWCAAQHGHKHTTASLQGNTNSNKLIIHLSPLTLKLLYRSKYENSPGVLKKRDEEEEK